MIFLRQLCLIDFKIVEIKYLTDVLGSNLQQKKKIHLKNDYYNYSLRDGRLEFH